MNVNFFVFLPYLQDHGFLAYGSIRAYCQALILRQLLEEGVPEVSPLGHFSFGFHFYQGPYSPVLLPN